MNEQEWAKLTDAQKVVEYDNYIATLRDQLGSYELRGDPKSFQTYQGLSDAALSDANIPAAFTNKMLEYFSAEMFRAEELPTYWRDVFFVSSEMPDTMDTFTQHYWTSSGVVSWFRAGGEIPMVEVGGVPVSIRCDWLVNGYEVTDFELETARATGVPLEPERAIAAREAHEVKANAVTFLGDAETNRIGLLNHPNITTANAPTGTWSGATTLQILADLNYLASRPFIATKTNASKNGTKLKILVSPPQWSIATETPMSVENTESIAQTFVKNSPWIDSMEDFMAIPECEGNGTAGVDVAMAVPKNRRYCEVIMPSDVHTRPSVLGLLKMQVPVASKFGALMVRYPLYLYQMENI